MASTDMGKSGSRLGPAPLAPAAGGFSSGGRRIGQQQHLLHRNQNPGRFYMSWINCLVKPTNTDIPHLKIPRNYLGRAWNTLSFRHGGLVHAEKNATLESGRDPAFTRRQVIAKKRILKSFGMTSSQRDGRNFWKIKAQAMFIPLSRSCEIKVIERQ